MRCSAQLCRSGEAHAVHRLTPACPPRMAFCVTFPSRECCAGGFAGQAVHHGTSAGLSHWRSSHGKGRRATAVCALIDPGDPPSSPRIRPSLGRIAARMRPNPSKDFERYDPVAIAQYYERRPHLIACRMASVALPFGIWYLRAKAFPEWLWLREKNTTRNAAQLRELIAWAGATALKLGQAASSRPDVVGPIYMTELQKLTDDVGPFESATAQRMVCEELGLARLEDAFESFEAEPVASASLGQVHHARLRTGEEVAVKVQRPNIKEQASLDVYIMRQLAVIAKKRFKLRSDLVGIVDEFGTQLWQEVDYNNEADNTEKFRQYYVGRVAGVYVPKVYRAYCTRRILVTEWIDGDKPPWYPKDDADKLIAIGVNCSLDQLLGDFGLVHGDPHAGNLFRRTSPSSPNTKQLVWLDFGMCINVDRETRVDLIRAITHLINRNFEQLALDFARLGFLMDGADPTLLVPKLHKAFEDAEDGGSGLSELSFSKLADNLAELASTSPIRIPVAFTVLIRSLTILEGLALQSDPSFKIVDAAYPYVVRRLLEDDSPALQEALKEVLLDSDGRLRWNRLDSILKVSDEINKSIVKKPSRGEPRKAAPGVLAGISESAKQRVMKFIFSPRGAFLRHALARELAEMVDAAQLETISRLSVVTRGVVPAPKETWDPAMLTRFSLLVGLFNNRENWLKPDSRVIRELGKAAWIVTGEMTDRNVRRIIHGFGECAMKAISASNNKQDHMD